MLVRWRFDGVQFHNSPDGLSATVGEPGEDDDGQDCSPFIDGEAAASPVARRRVTSSRHSRRVLYA